MTLKRVEGGVSITPISLRCKNVEFLCFLERRAEKKTNGEKRAIKKNALQKKKSALKKKGRLKGKEKKGCKKIREKHENKEKNSLFLN